MCKIDLRIDYARKLAGLSVSSFLETLGLRGCSSHLMWPSWLKVWTPLVYEYVVWMQIEICSLGREVYK